MTKLVRSPDGRGLEVNCEPGEPTDTTAYCQRHSQHYYCSTCKGYYGVPHDFGIHEGPDKHPNRFYRDCACRVCQNHRVELGEKQ